MLSSNIFILRIFSLKDFMNIVATRTFSVGQVVASWRIFYWHWGIVTDSWKDGEQTVISCSGLRRMVVEEPMSLFRQGNPIESRDFTSTLPVREVLVRARGKLGQRYDLLSWNCEHFVYDSFGFDKQSPQLKKFAICAIGLALLR